MNKAILALVVAGTLVGGSTASFAATKAPIAKPTAAATTKKAKPAKKAAVKPSPVAKPAKK